MPFAESLIYCFLELYLGDLPWKFGLTAECKAGNTGNACAQAANNTAEEIQTDHGGQADHDKKELDVTGETGTDCGRKELDMTGAREVTSGSTSPTKPEGQLSDISEQYSCDSSTPGKVDSTSSHPDACGEQARKAVKPTNDYGEAAHRNLTDTEKHMASYEW
jgi:hypothetical protein